MLKVNILLIFGGTIFFQPNHTNITIIFIFLCLQEKVSPSPYAYQRVPSRLQPSTKPSKWQSTDLVSLGQNSGTKASIHSHSDHNVLLPIRWWVVYSSNYPVSTNFLLNFLYRMYLYVYRNPPYTLVSVDCNGHRSSFCMHRKTLNWKCLRYYPVKQQFNFRWCHH